MDFEGDITDANLNFLEFMKMKPLRDDQMKFQRVVTAQGASTFDDIKQNLEEFSR